MRQEERKDFDKEAAQWETPDRIKLGNDVAEAVMREVELNKDMDVLDFGCGTGLVILRLQPFVRTITGADSSKGMLDVLERKVRERQLANVRTQFLDIDAGGNVSGSYDLIVSSMTVHHVPDTGALFRQWSGILRPDGKICFADLDAEDGSFHADRTGVFHFGFERAKLKELLAECGFRDLRDMTAATIVRNAEGQGKKFPVFLMTGRKR